MRRGAKLCFWEHYRRWRKECHIQKSRWKLRIYVMQNANGVENFSPKTLNGITSFRISISGITKETYERIYGLDVERVKRNIYTG